METDTSSNPQSLPLHDLPELPAVRLKKIPFAKDLSNKALVIDNGSYTFRIGWSGEAAPRLTFRNKICRPRSKQTNEVLTCVGEWGNGLKGYDFGKSTFKDAFDDGVVTNYDTQEYVFDYAFERLSITGGEVRHPVVITEAPLNPPSCRTAMAELLFEAYAVPALHFTTDAACSHHHAARHGLVGWSGVVVASGHAATHVLPVLNGQPQYQYCIRLKAAGSLATQHLQKMLLVKYPQHATVLSGGCAGPLKEQHCYCAADYRAELASMQRDFATAGGKALRIQLPWTPVKQPTKEEQEEEAARKAAKAAELRAKMKELAAQRKERLLVEKEQLLAGFRDLLQQVEDAGSADKQRALLNRAKFKSVKELQRYAEETEAAVRRMKGLEAAPKPAEALEDHEAFPLLDVPDEQLTAEQIKEKRRQRLLKAGKDARDKAKARKEAEKAALEAQRAAEDEALARDPEGYLEALKERHRAVTARLQSRKRRKLGGSSQGAAGAGAAEGGQAAAGSRRNADQRERMRLVAQAAFEGKADVDDGFGADDRDWEVYKAMGTGGGSDSEAAQEEEAEYQYTLARLQELGQADFVAGLGGEGGSGMGPQKVVTAEDFQVYLGVERIAPPELLFQPCLAGVEQASVTEAVMQVLARLPKEASEACAEGGVLLSGGNSLYPGFRERLEAELTACRPLGRPLKVIHCEDPLQDPWRGAAQLASVRGLFTGGSGQALTRADYEEKGAEYLREYRGMRFPSQV